MKNHEQNGEPTVFIVDDDDAIRDSLCLLLSSVGLKVEAFASAQAFLDTYTPGQLGCLVLDIRMPGMSGLELQQALNERQSTLPVIFITGHGDVPMAVEAMKQGALDFIQKPFRDQELLERISQALEQVTQRRKALSEQHAITQRIATLTAREHEVLERVIAGKANKVIAMELGISQRTVEIHRARIMKKMRAKSLAQLIRMVIQAQA